MNPYTKIQQELQEAARSAGRDENELLLVVASKYFSSQQIRNLYGLGQRLFGENRLQDALLKMKELRDLDIEWHFFGHVQTNKAVKICENFSVIHSLDSLRLAGMLEKHCRESDKILRVFIQVNLASEESKSGYDKNSLYSEFGELVKLPHVRPVGLMTITPVCEDPAASAPLFRELRMLRDELNIKFGTDLKSLSMGMSQDYRYAVMEGATHIRIGRALLDH